jgi:FtsP/CotA-like multicopper oxidase with cupredoxin domain
MSRNQRIALVVVALLVAVAAFALARPGDDDGGDGGAQTPPPADTGSTTTGERTDTQPAPKPKPEIARIRIRGGAVAGGPSRIEVTNGETVRIVVSADAPDEIHLHGYDITRNAAPGRPARFGFRADNEGIFEIESHVATDAGKDPLVARLVVEP